MQSERVAPSNEACAVRCTREVAVTERSREAHAGGGEAPPDPPPPKDDLMGSLARTSKGASVTENEVPAVKMTEKRCE
jgi:hypothetical protein